MSRAVRSLGASKEFVPDLDVSRRGLPNGRFPSQGGLPELPAQMEIRIRSSPLFDGRRIRIAEVTAPFSRVVFWSESESYAIARRMDSWRGRYRQLHDAISELCHWVLAKEKSRQPEYWPVVSDAGIPASLAQTWYWCERTGYARSFALRGIWRQISRRASRRDESGTFWWPNFPHREIPYDEAQGATWSTRKGPPEKRPHFLGDESGTWTSRSAATPGVQTDQSWTKGTTSFRR